MKQRIVKTLKYEIKEVIINAIKSSIINDEIPNIEIPKINIEIPREKENGDFSTNIAMQFTKIIKKSPKISAEIIIKNMILKGTCILNVECKGAGFINFNLNNNWLCNTLKIIQLQKENYGKIDIGNGQRVMVEFVSANPTGPLHMGNARGGALGDFIASVLEVAGYDVCREFYINDAGNQMEKFGMSLEARYLQLLNGEDNVEFPSDGYHGEDIIENAKEYIKNYGDKLLNLDSVERKKILSQYALPKNLKKIKEALLNYGIEYDVWFSEQSLYDSGELDETLNILKEKGFTYEKEGATWLKILGNNTEKDVEKDVEKDEVIIKNNGLPTYFLLDIVYHRNKFINRKFDRVINLWGADHHGHVARMKNAMVGLDIAADRLDIVLFQLVHLFRDGEKVRMSKRTGKAISLIDLLEEVGKDAARFFFNMKVSGSHLDFDLDLAVKASNENPVFYVQYAHARICSILRLLESNGIDIPNCEDVNLNLLECKEEIELIKKLAYYQEEIEISAKSLEPSRITRYVIDVSGLFHSFYNACRVRIEDQELMKARIILIDSTRIVIKNVLELMKILAPEKM